MLAHPADYCISTEEFFFGIMHLGHESNHSPLHILWCAQRPLHVFILLNTAAAGNGDNKFYVYKTVHCML
jgi:hypothetical protein